MDAGFAAGLNLTMTVPGLILAVGTPDQQERWLPGIAAGETVLAGAMNEPSVAGSELFNPEPDLDSGYRSRAVRDGDDYVINGAKAQWVTNAGAADAYIVFARTATDRPGVQSTSAFWVPAGTPGLSCGPRSRLLGLRTGFHAEVFLDDVRVPATSRIGPEGQALRLLMSTTPGMAVGLAATFVGVARAAEDLARAHAAQRRSWGRPLHDHQAVALDLAEMAVSVRTARLLVHEAATALDEEGPTRASWRSSFRPQRPAPSTRRSTARNAPSACTAPPASPPAQAEKLLRDAWTGYSCDFTREMLHLGIASALPASERRR